MPEPTDPRSTRLVMLGTGDFALPTFRHLIDSGFAVVGLITQPDRPQGRRQEIIPGPIKREAIARGIRVEQPEDVNAPDGLDRVRSLAPDLLVTAAYGQILSAELLTIPRHGGINLHGSILPAYRGAAPVARAIQDGRDETGVTVIRMSPRVDAGGMLSFATTPIGPDETAGQVEARLAAIGAPLVSEAVAAIVAGRAEFLPQDASRVTKAPKLRKEEGVVDWSRPARAVHDHARAMRPWPRASTRWHPSVEGRSPVRLILLGTSVESASGEPGRVVEAAGDRLVVAAGSGSVRLVEVQPEGRQAMGAAEFLRGQPVRVGDRLGD